MRKICLIPALIWLCISPARADFTAGLEAYDGGDYALAAVEWRGLAQRGDIDAQIALAGLFMQGLGVDRDPGRAVHWYRQAARQGAAVAQLNLGDLYARGLGVKRDLVRAYAWLELAARAGQIWARRRRDEIGRQLSAERMTAAMRLVEQPTSMR